MLDKGLNLFDEYAPECTPVPSGRIVSLLLERTIKCTPLAHSKFIEDAN